MEGVRRVATKHKTNCQDANENCTEGKPEDEMKAKISPVNSCDNDDNYLPSEPGFVLAICVIRLVGLIGWTGGILYCTYQIYLAAEGRLFWQRDPIMNPGPFSEFLDRGRDTSDYEWRSFTGLFFTRLIYWYAAYVIFVGIWGSKYPKLLNKVSITMSIVVLWRVIGAQPTVFVAVQPILYWLLLRFRRKLLIWGITIGILFSINGGLVKVIVGNVEEAQYYFVITIAWNCARCVSFAFDSWNIPKSETNGIGSLYAVISYCFYFPLMLTGPLILFDSFEKHVRLRQPKDESREDSKSKLMLLMENFTRLLIITILNELLLHYLYFRPLSLSPAVLKDVNLWVICGLIYWLGQFFSLKYKVMYGFPTVVAEYEGANMPPLPRCPAYLHRYSVLWKDFDRGLYNFLIRYTYLPVIQFLGTFERTKNMPMDAKKLVASFISFCYIYLWHSTAFDVLVWAGLNFLGITIERIGSVIKRKIDSEQRLQPIVWDFIIEPIVTVPLAAMSILNSSVFCGSLESAQVFATRLWAQWHECYAFMFLYCFTHVAVTVRTWDQFLAALKNRRI